MNAKLIVVIMFIGIMVVGAVQWFGNEVRSMQCESALLIAHTSTTTDGECK